MNSWAKFSSDSHYDTEFSGSLFGEARFRHEPSGTELRLQLTDTDDSGWGGSSGLGAIDVDYDSDDGSHIETEFEFGVVEWQADDLLRNIAQAFEYQQNVAIPYGSESSVETFDSPSTQRWDLQQIDVWANGTSPFPDDDLFNLFNAAIENQDISFKTNFSGFNSSDPYAPIKFEVSDFIDNTLDIQSGTAGFDLYLNGPQTDILNKPHTNNYHGTLNYQAYFSDANIPIGDWKS